MFLFSTQEKKNLLLPAKGTLFSWEHLSNCFKRQYNKNSNVDSTNIGGQP